MNFPIPEATYALSSVQVKWVDENGAELTIPGYTPTEVEKLICDYDNKIDDGKHQVYTPAYTTDYTTITERIALPDGSGAYYQYVGTTYTADGAPLDVADAVNPKNAAAHVVIHQYKLMQPGEVAISGVKYIEGATFDQVSDKNGNKGSLTYTFELKPATGSKTTVDITPTSGNSAGFDFGTLKFEQPGTYVYTITETPDDDHQYRVHRDQTVYTLTITVDENLQVSTKLTATLDGVTTDAEQITLPDFPTGTYTVTEENAEGYTAAYQVNSSAETSTPASVTFVEGVQPLVTVINTPKVGNLEISKVIPWSYDIMKADAFVFRITGPDGFTGSVSYTLNGERKTGAVSADGVLTVEGIHTGDVIVLENVPVGEYTVSEAAADGNKLVYTAAYSDDANAGKATVAQDQTAQMTITNHPTETVFTKLWDDDNNQSGLRPDTAELAKKLLVLKGARGLQSGCSAADFTVFGDAVIVVTDQADGHMDNAYRVVALGLPELESGFTYYLAEKDVLPYEAMNTILSANFTFTKNGVETTGRYHVFAEHSDDVVLNYLATTLEIAVTKVWDDDGNQDGLRPGSVSIHLLANGAASGDTVELGYGQKIVIEGLIPGCSYKVTELTTPAFTTVVNGSFGHEAEGLLTETGAEVSFVNTLVTTEFSVTKEWRGGDGGAIRLTLYANGEKLDPQPECFRENNHYWYKGLPKFDENGGTITNSKIPQTGDEAPLALWITLMGTSAALMLILRKRRRA